MKKFAIILSGCGQFDGSETHETILTLLSLAQENVEWDAFAPDIPQRRVVNHVTNDPEPTETRSVLKESARLVRGKIKPITKANINDYDAIVLPGGYGAVNNLCTWSEDGVAFTINEQVKQFLDQAASNNIPAGFICIAPVMIPKIYDNATLTIGNDASIAEKIEQMGSHHEECLATGIIVDKERKIVTTPANMVAKGRIEEVYEGIHKLVKELVKLSA